ncbi:outer membrane beta-barrel protein [Shewanella sp. GXUN23E]|uniref:OmpA family protein n=1 Tax=Shewanella sp. GXUN23E TaxID=3422498 RepID=UPI003D7F147B
MAIFARNIPAAVIFSSLVTGTFPLVAFSLAAEPAAPSSDEAQTPGSAEQPAEFSSYFYLGAKAGWMHYQQACEDWSIDCEADDLGWGAFVGYQLTENLGFEAAYLDLGEAQAIYSESGVNQTYTGSMSGIELSAVGRLWLTENWSLFAKAGALGWHGKNRGPWQTTKDDGWAPMLGLGTEYLLSDNWQLRLEYQYMDKLGSDLLGGSNGHFTSLGLSYRFGERAKPAPVPPPPTKPVPPVVTLPPPIKLPALHQVVLFDFDSDRLLSSQGLDDIVKRLTTHPESKVQVKGYTDNVGNPAYNLKLSTRRAVSVAQYLLKMGVARAQIELEGFGEAFPVAANDSAEHRHLNRRVDVFLPAYEPEISDKSSIESQQDAQHKTEQVTGQGESQ